MKKSIILINIFLLISLTGCGAKFKFKKGQNLEKKRYYIEACLLYEDIYTKYPSNSISPNSLYRIGYIYQNKLKLYTQAGAYYKKLIELYPKSEPWVSLAKDGLLSCPDYFPLRAGSFWVEGDSETKGNNMRAEWSCIEISSGTFCIKRRIFSGRGFVNETKKFYIRKNFEIKEFQDLKQNNYKIIFSYPYFRGKTWAFKHDGIQKKFEIISMTEALKIKAGEFSNCMKIAEKASLVRGSIKYNYYAPDIGWILTTAAASADGKEHTITELISYKIMPKPE